MSWLLDALTSRYHALDTALDTVGMLEPHDTQWNGRAWKTPSIIDHDDGNTNDD